MPSEGSLGTPSGAAESRPPGAKPSTELLPPEIPEAVRTGRPTPVPGPSPVRRAWILAIVADGIQIAFLPLFTAGFLSPASDILDVIVAVLMVRLLGWHPAFLPTFIAELVPALDLFPTWTAAVWFATRGRPRSG